MANRIRVSVGLAILLFAVGFTPTVTAESAVELDNPIWLAERDLGIEAIAVGGETTQKVLVAGAEGYANARRHTHEGEAGEARRGCPLRGAQAILRRLRSGEDSHQ